MKPPICHLCKKPVSAVHSQALDVGNWVQFADYQPLPDGMVGHPHGLEWFCAEHVGFAEALSAKGIDEAMLEMRRNFDLLQPVGFLHRLTRSLKNFLNPSANQFKP